MTKRTGRIRSLYAAATLVWLIAGLGAVALGQETGPRSLPLAGDADCSGVVDVGDALQVRRAVAGLEALDGACQPDMDGDGDVTASDAVCLLSAIAGLEVSCRADILTVSITFFDVGQGDAILVTVGSARMLIDGGSSGPLMLSRLAELGVDDLDVIVATHPDSDHAGGLIAVLESYDIERIYVNGSGAQTQTYIQFLQAAADEQAEFEALSRGELVSLGGLLLPVLSPGPLTGSTNNDSVVLQLECGPVKTLLTGDAEQPAENGMMSAGVLVDVSVLKVGHHGSNGASSLAFLQTVQPEVAVISAGVDNQYGHPHPETLERLAQVGAGLVYTDVTDGVNDTVTLTTDCVGYEFSKTPVPAATATHTATNTATQGIATNTPTRTPTQQQSNCSPAYPTVCIPPPPPDLDCGDIPYRRFTVLAPDPHGFDGNGNGIGCE